ncbi:MAG: tRNA pseudouridine(38-40) synthase TruA, partial [Dehalococcoidales bacterium]|nr:tRNA pseudouridine(38-40) synthase TruA [Dehalococcoidales bacterium]
ASRQFALVVEYDGSEFFGFQRQSVRRTVQSEIEEALYRITQDRVRIAAAGRTDTGVHALGQVVSFASGTRLDPADLLRALNAVLPADVAVSRCVEVGDGFHARFSARGREYTYVILNRRWPSPVCRQRAYHVAWPLDDGAMEAGCRELVGTHDFAAFSGGGRREKTVRTVQQASCRRSGERVEIAIAADAFLPHMVRNIVGTLVWLGTGKVDLPAFVRIIRTGKRSLAGPTAPPQGLYLTRVNYGNEWQGVIG